MTAAFPDTFDALAALKRRREIARDCGSTVSEIEALKSLMNDIGRPSIGLLARLIAKGFIVRTSKRAAWSPLIITESGLFLMREARERGWT